MGEKKGQSVDVNRIIDELDNNSKAVGDNKQRVDELSDSHKGLQEELDKSTKKIIKNTNATQKTEKEIKDLTIAEQKLINVKKELDKANAKLLNRKKLLTTHTRNLGSSLSVLRSNLLIVSFTANSLSKVVLGQTRAWADYREAIGRVHAVLKSTNNAVGVSVGQIKALATELQETTGVSDTFTISTAALLASFKNIHEEVFPAAIKSIIDTTAAMHGGKVTEEALRAETVRLGKALNDPIKGMTALTRVGVTFSTQQKQQINLHMLSGKSIKAQQMILKELNDEFADQASVEGYNNTMRVLSTAVGDLQKRIGEQLTPTVIAFAESMTQAVELLDANRVIRWTKSLGAAYVSVAILSKALRMKAAAAALTVGATTKLAKATMLLKANYMSLVFGGIMLAVQWYQNLTKAKEDNNKVPFVEDIKDLKEVNSQLREQRQKLKLIEDDLKAIDDVVTKGRQASGISIVPLIDPEMVVPSKNETEKALGMIGKVLSMGFKGWKAIIQKDFGPETMTEIAMSAGATEKLQVRLKSLNKTVSGLTIKELRDNLIALKDDVKGDTEEINKFIDELTKLGVKFSETSNEADELTEKQVKLMASFKSQNAALSMTIKNKGEEIQSNKVLLQVMQKLGVTYDSSKTMMQNLIAEYDKKLTLEENLIKSGTILREGLDEEIALNIKNREEINLLTMARKNQNLAIQTGIDLLQLHGNTKAELHQMELERGLAEFEAEQQIELNRIDALRVSEETKARLRADIDKKTQQEQIKIHNKIIDSKIKMAKGDALVGVARVTIDSIKGWMAVHKEQVEASALAKSYTAAALLDPRYAPAAIAYEGLVGVLKKQKAGVVASGIMQAGMAAAQGSAQVSKLKSQKQKAAALGTDFVTSGPTNLLVGDNPGARERVQVTPLSSTNVYGPGGDSNITVNITGNVLTEDFVENELADAIRDAVRKGSDYGMS
tara:strand:- start:9245 stop:12100 length:2856 start_codon:yes stop_codon:yes gene_type:complete